MQAASQTILSIAPSRSARAHVRGRASRASLRFAYCSRIVAEFLIPADATCVGHGSDQGSLQGARCFGDVGRLGSIQTSSEPIFIAVDRSDQYACAVLADASITCWVSSLAVSAVTAWRSSKQGQDAAGGINDWLPSAKVFRGPVTTNARASTWPFFPVICAVRLNGTLWCSSGSGLSIVPTATYQYVAYGGNFPNDAYRTPWFFVMISGAGTVSLTAADSNTESLFTRTPPADSWVQVRSCVAPCSFNAMLVTDRSWRAPLLLALAAGQHLV